jgi:alpha-galactosidase
VIVGKFFSAALSMAFPMNRNVFELLMPNWIKVKQQSTMLEQLFDCWKNINKKFTEC